MTILEQLSKKNLDKVTSLRKAIATAQDKAKGVMGCSAVFYGNSRMGQVIELLRQADEKIVEIVNGPGVTDKLLSVVSRKEKVYKGARLGPREKLPGVVVMVDDKPLKHRVHHSPTGFEWGYGGSGPADLARSILWDYLGKEPAPALYQSFKEQFVARWGDKWKMTGHAITLWMEAKAEKASMG